MLNANMIDYNHYLREQEEIQTSSNELIQLSSDEIDQFISINNVTSNFNVKTHLDLRHLARHGYNVEYKRGVKYLYI